MYYDSTMLKKRLTSSLLVPLLLGVAGFNCLILSAQAEETNIYKQTNKDGVVEFTDIPNKSGKQIQIPEMNTFKQKAMPHTVSPKKATPALEKYTEFTITSPLRDKVVRENAGNVTVMLNLVPALKPAHTVKVVIDNDPKLTLTGSSIIFSFKNISRGTHTVLAYILDGQGTVLMESPSVEFNLQRFHISP